MQENFQWLGLIFGWVLVGLLGLFGGAIAFGMFMGRIKLNKLISEANGDASLSRFQFLIFTYVIAGGVLLGLLASYHAGTAGAGVTFPAIPGDLLALLGISGGSYVVSKGIQKNAESANPEQAVDPSAPKPEARPGWPS
jgi:hypothetical protein